MRHGKSGYYCIERPVLMLSLFQVPEDAPLWIQKKLKARIDKVDLLNKIAEELPDEMKVTPYWEKRLEAAGKQ